MTKSYYVIELTARWLTVLVVALAVLMVLAFGLGYGAAWSVLAADPPPPVKPTPTPLVTTEILPEPTGIELPSTPTPVPATATAPRPATATPAPPTAPPATATATPRPSPTGAAVSGFLVQVMASAHGETIDAARSRLAELGFDREHQQVVETEVAGGNELLKLRVGPFPDRESADRVVARMQAAGFPDAWVVVP